MIEIVETLEQTAPRIEPVPVRTTGEISRGRWSFDLRIAAKIPFRKAEVQKQFAVVASEPISPIVPRPALLADTGHRFEVAVEWTKAEVMIADVHRRSRGFRGQLCGAA